MKTLRIIGNGYLQTSNSNLINIPFFVNPSQIGTVTINSTAIGTVLQGISFSGVNIKAQNVIIERCYAGNGTINLIRDNLGSNASGAIIAKNFLIKVVFSGYYVIPVSPSCSYTDYQIENVTIKNNLHVDINFQFSTVLRRGGNCAISNSHIEVPSLKNSSISNNTNYSVINMYGENTTYQNNICELFYLQGTVSFPSNFITASNNVCISACGYGNNNVQNVLLSSLYSVSSPSPSIDNNYILSPTSPAIGAGLGGIDAGAYGGSDPYRISGLAPIPQITSYSKNASSGVYTTTTPMTVTISVRGNN